MWNLNLNKLTGKPLLLSALAEGLCTRVVVATCRMSSIADFELGDYVIPKNLPMVFFSRVSAFNRDAWAAARPSTLSRPLGEFWAKRFLMGKGTEAPSQDNNTSQCEDMPKR